MNAKDFLRQIKKLDRLIENKLIEAQQWKEIATNTTTNLSGEKVESSHNPQRISDAICTYMDLEMEARRCVDELVKAKKDVISVIEQLNAMEYDVLHKVYVQYLTFDEIAFICQHSRSWVTTIHGRALKHVQNILDMRTE